MSESTPDIGAYQAPAPTVGAWQGTPETIVGTPAITPTSGAYASTQLITITTATVGAAIYYTEDGSTPTAADTLYTAPFELGVSKTIKAIGIKAGLGDSEVATEVYTVAGVAAPVIDPASGRYESGQLITITTATVGASIYYTEDGSTPDAADTLYTAPFELDVSKTIKAIAILAGYVDSEVTTARYFMLPGALFLRLFQHLLPNARAWRLTIEKQLRQFFEGLSGLGADLKLFFDQIWTDVDPEQTRELTAWENQFGLPDTVLTDQQRRDRLAAAWATTGGQSPAYIQGVLQANGFDVYVHSWWVPGTELAVNVSGPPGTVRNPLDYLSGGLIQATDCGEAFMECGEALAECGEYFSEAGDALVNKGLGPYVISSDADTWPFYIYISGETFPNLASVQLARRDEFEALCLKLCPCQMWLGLLVTYV